MSIIWIYHPQVSFICYRSSLLSSEQKLYQWYMLFSSSTLGWHIFKISYKRAQTGYWVTGFLLKIIQRSSVETLMNIINWKMMPLFWNISADVQINNARTNKSKIWSWSIKTVEFLGLNSKAHCIQWIIHSLRLRHNHYVKLMQEIIQNQWNAHSH